MSQQLIDRSDDLRRLQNDGYDVSIQGGYLILRLPYVNGNREVKDDGLLISTLDMSGDTTVRPTTHVVSFAGSHPCDVQGRPLDCLGGGAIQNDIVSGLTANYQFSAKPNSGYADYYQKMNTYASMISGPAQTLNPSIKARPHNVIVPDDGNSLSVFNYIDTASTRAGINIITEKLKLDKVAIIGVGGTGSYVLDLIAKTPVQEIHLIDGDEFLQHNAFRGPGAPDLDTLKAKPNKAEYFASLYSAMRKGIIAHPNHINQDTLDILNDMTFVFMCIDVGKIKKPIIERLEEKNIPFIDVGMGIYEAEGKLAGQLRVSTGAKNRQSHCYKRIDLKTDEGDGVYEQNIQIADMNALNAALAVIKWKKIYGFYNDLENEHFSLYTVDGNRIVNMED